MPQEGLNFLERLNEYGVFGYLWLLFVSLWGGTVKYLTGLNGSTPTFFGWLIEVTVSGFVGVIAASVCQYFEMDFLITSAVTGIAAHQGTRSLYLISQILKKKSVIDFPIEEQRPIYKRDTSACKRDKTE